MTCNLINRPYNINYINDNSCYDIGDPILTFSNVLKSNEIWLEGSIENINTYPKLAEKYGTTYGGDGITTFGLPDCRGRVVWCSADGSFGYIEAKLPNIKGFVAVPSSNGAIQWNLFSTTSGALGVEQRTLNAYLQMSAGNSQFTTAGINIDASRSSSVYSDDTTTVQPPAIKCRVKTRFE